MVATAALFHHLSRVRMCQHYKIFIHLSIPSQHMHSFRKQSA